MERPTASEKYLTLAGFLIIFIGSTLNGMAILANNGKMPVLVSKEFFGENMAEDVKIELESSRWHQPLTSESRMVILADRFYVLKNRAATDISIFSIGDVFVLSGLAINLTALAVIFYNSSIKTRSPKARH